MFSTENSDLTRTLDANCHTPKSWLIVFTDGDKSYLLKKKTIQAKPQSLFCSLIISNLFSQNINSPSTHEFNGQFKTTWTMLSFLFIFRR